MWENSVTIRHPFGVSVFGSAMLRVSPDSATIKASVTSVELKPADAFAKARKGARSAADFLHKAGVADFGMSQITLTQERRYTGGESKFAGYKVKIGFTIVVKALDRCEEIVTGLVEAGANEIGSTVFQTSMLKELRAQVRVLAVEAAREKAAIYAAAARVSLGDIIHLEDVNPAVLQGRSEGHVIAEPPEADEARAQTLDPGAIEVGAAVLIAFALAGKSGV